MNGHVLKIDYMICRLCGDSYENILDKKRACSPTPLFGKERCVECTLIREVFSCMKGWTCQECIDQIRSDGVALYSSRGQ